MINLEQVLMEVQHKFRNVKVEKKANKLFEVSYKRPKDWSIDIKIYPSSIVNVLKLSFNVDTMEKNLIQILDIAHSWHLVLLVEKVNIY